MPGACPTGDFPLQWLDEQISEVESLQEIGVHSAPYPKSKSFGV